MAVGYIASKTIPANTPASAPLVFDIYVNEPIVKDLGILFPLNAAYLVGVALCDYEQQFLPATGSTDAWIRDDGREVTWHDMNHILKGSPYLVRVKAYNEDATYSRTVEVRLTMARTTLLGQVERLAEAIEDLAASRRQA